MSKRAAPSPSASDPLHPEARRFRDDLTRALGAEPSGGLLLAVSGGPDSMAMLTLARAAGIAGLHVATVDHRLRAEAAAEAAMVADHARSLGLPHATLTPGAPIEGASLQAAARRARYGLLADHARNVGVAHIATAHHADDQAETFLMRAARGSGIAGLAGVRARTIIEGSVVVRPLLDWRRAELRAIVRRADVPFVDDPSNHDPAHDRTRFRRLLDANEWLGPPQLARAAGALAEADADMRAMVDWLWTVRAQRTATEVRVDVNGLPRELARRLVRRGVDHVVGGAGLASSQWSESANVETLLDALFAGRRATQAGVLVSAHGTEWRFRPAPPRRSASRTR